MKKLIQKILPAMISIIAGIGLVSPALTVPTYAAAPAHSGVGTISAEGAAILKGCYARGENSDDGDGIRCVIELVIDILSVVIGIVGVIGIVIVGIQYLTAGGNEEQTRKAKRRLFEIIIGIVAYVLIYALLKWLLPGFN